MSFPSSSRGAPHPRGKHPERPRHAGPTGAWRRASLTLLTRRQWRHLHAMAQHHRLWAASHEPTDDGWPCPRWQSTTARAMPLPAIGAPRLWLRRSHHHNQHHHHHHHCRRRRRRPPLPIPHSLQSHPLRPLRLALLHGELVGRRGNMSAACMSTTASRWLALMPSVQWLYAHRRPLPVPLSSPPFLSMSAVGARL